MKKQLKPTTSPVITALSHEGRGITHIDGKTTFIAYALPGETVSFQYTKKRGKFDEGVATEVLTASPDRVAPPCKHFGICGGCALQHMSIDSQRLHKKAVLRSLLANTLQSDTKIESLNDAATVGYRRRARLSVRYVPKKNKVLVGFREKNSHFVTDILQCETLHPSVGHQLSALSHLLMQLEGKTSIPQIEVAISDTQTAIVVRHLAPLSKSDLDKLSQFSEKQTWQCFLQPGNETTIHPLFPEKPEPLFYDIPSEKLRLYFQPAQFTQINQAINLEMISQALAWLALEKTDHALDLFCGIGNFSLPIARYAAQVTGIEGAASAIQQARLNAEKNKLSNTSFHTYNLFESLEHIPWAKQTFDKILLDPPRTGAKEIIPHLKIWKPKRILYVSCNPLTFARDTAELHALGYQLKKISCMDMFPHTEHSETMGLFIPA